MRKVASLLCGAAVISMGLSAAVPAQARDWHRGHYWHGYHHRNNGAAIALGVIGGALAGAAVASGYPYYYSYSYPYSYPAYGYYYPY